MRTQSLVLTALLVLAAGCQTAAPASPPTGQRPASAPTEGAPPAEVNRLLTTARAAGETELSLSWSENTLGGNEGAQRLTALMNRMYGTDIKVTFTPGPSMTDMAAKVSQELPAGRKASTDVLIGSEGHFGSLLNRDVLESYDYTLLSPRITGDVVGPQNIAVEIVSRFPGITYNSDLVRGADVPRRLEDALDPKWRGKIASTPNAASFDRVSYRPDWGTDRMRDYVTRLSQNIGGLLRCGESARVVTGEFLMLVMDCGSYEARRQREKGAPLASSIPADAVTAVFFYLGIPRNSAHPNLAKLFVNTVLSEAGQKIVYEMDAADHYALPGSQSAAELADLKARGIEPFKVDIRYVAEHPEGANLDEEFRRILREKVGG
jgi:ABC-type Fe3+ transport system substrate-binding protein